MQADLKNKPLPSKYRVGGTKEDISTHNLKNMISNQIERAEYQ